MVFIASISAVFVLVAGQLSCDTVTILASKLTGSTRWNSFILQVVHWKVWGKKDFVRLGFRNRQKRLLYFGHDNSTIKAPKALKPQLNVENNFCQVCCATWDVNAMPLDLARILQENGNGPRSLPENGNLQWTLPERGNLAETQTFLLKQKISTNKTLSMTPAT